MIVNFHVFDVQMILIVLLDQYSCIRHKIGASHKLQVRIAMIRGRVHNIRANYNVRRCGVMK